MVIILILYFFYTGESCAQTVYGTVGDTVYLHLQEPQGKPFEDVRWAHENVFVANSKSSVKPLAEVCSNGTLKLYNIERYDSGFYTAQAFDEDGTFKLNESSYLLVIGKSSILLTLILNSRLFTDCRCVNKW